MSGNIREWAKDVVRSVPSVPIRDTDAVPTFKHRVTACIDRAAVLLALEHALPPAADQRAVTLLRDFLEWIDQLETFESKEDDAYVLLSSTDRNILVEQFGDAARSFLHSSEKASDQERPE